MKESVTIRRTGLRWISMTTNRCVKQDGAIIKGEDGGGKRHHKEEQNHARSFK